MTRIALIPLDERPVNTRYPQMLGEIAGAEILLPPEPIRGLQRQGADLRKVIEWLRAVVESGVDAVAVSCDFLGYGNLISARITDDSAADVLGRLSLLQEIGARIPVHAFSLITRAPNANDNVEEPLYWKEWGTKLATYARLTHRAELAAAGGPSPLTGNEQDLLEALAANIPPDILSDWLTRRLRNHVVNLALIDMAARGRIASLLLTSDDTAPYGFPTRERDWMRGWLGLIGEQRAANVRMYPGADEVGSALVARLVNRQAGLTPHVLIDYAIAGDDEVVAPYEDRPVRETIAGQIEACGCAISPGADPAGFVLGVATPSRRGKDYQPQFLEEDRATRAGAYKDFLIRLAAFQNRGIPVALADVAYPNGSDPLLTEMLLAPECPLRPGELVAYGAWNTAGNTLGTVIAQATCSLAIDDDPGTTRALAQRRFLTHRFTEDYGYQQRIRREARAFAEQNWGRREPDPESVDEQRAICAFIEERLGQILSELQNVGVGEGLSIAPGSVRLPWRRTFEVDFELAGAQPT
jgi:hypothetical protein